MAREALMQELSLKSYVASPPMCSRDLIWSRQPNFKSNTISKPERRRLRWQRTSQTPPRQFELRAARFHMTMKIALIFQRYGSLEVARRDAYLKIESTIALTRAATGAQASARPGRHGGIQMAAINCARSEHKSKIPTCIAIRCRRNPSFMEISG